MFDLDQFVADLRASLSDRSSKTMKEIVACAVSDPTSLFRAIGEPDQPVRQNIYITPQTCRATG